MIELISDTSPIQYLHFIGRFPLLKDLGVELLVPEAVRDELEVGRKSGIDLPILPQIPWVRVLPAPLGFEAPFDQRLGPGERGAIAAGLQARGVKLLMDDEFARQEAQRLGLKVIGTLGVLLEAKRRGLLREVQPEFDRLEAAGFRLAAKTRAAVLQLAGE